MKFYTWEARRAFLIELKNAVVAKFPEENYNGFVFGSFIRDDYKPEESDLDLAVFSLEFDRELDVTYFIEDYLEERDIDSSIIEIDVKQYGAFAVIPPLRMNVSFTDYYPEELHNYLGILRRDYVWYQEDRDNIRRKKERLQI